MEIVSKNRIAKVFILSVLIILCFGLIGAGKASADSEISMKAEPLGNGSFALYVSGDENADLSRVIVYRTVDGGKPESVSTKVYQYSSVMAGRYIEDKDVSFDSK